MSEAFAELLREIRAEAAPIVAERARLRGLPRDCFWKEGSHIVPFWRDYWRKTENRGSHYALPIFPVLDAEFDVGGLPVLQDTDIPEFLREGW